jgi:hypothetical protein
MRLGGLRQAVERDLGRAHGARPDQLDDTFERRAGAADGRKPKLNPYQRQEALQRRASGEPLIEIATFGVSHSTISRLAEA